MDNEKTLEWYTFGAKKAYPLLSFKPEEWKGLRYGYYQVYHRYEGKEIMDGQGYDEFSNCIKKLMAEYNTEQHYIRCIAANSFEDAKDIYMRINNSKTN